MKVSNKWSAVAMLGWIATASPTRTAYAQNIPTPPPPRPPTGLYLGNQRDTGSHQALSMRLGLYGNFDNNVIGDQSLGTVGAKSNFRGRAVYPTWQAGLYYARRTSRVSFASSGDGSFAYYPDLGVEIPQPVDAYQGSAHLTTKVGRTSLRVGQWASYARSFQLNSFRNYADSPTLLVPVTTPGSTILPVETPGFTTEVSLLEHRNASYETTAGLNIPLARRTAADVDYAYRGSTFGREQAQDQLVDVTSQTAGVQLTQQVGRRSSLHGRYSYELARYDRPLVPKRNLTSQSGTAGFQYVHPRSTTRSIGIDLTGGFSAIDNEAVIGGPIVRRYESVVRIAANLRFARSWSAIGEYQRALQILQGFTQPYYGNSGYLGIAGTVSRRWDFLATARYAQGNIGINSSSSTPSVGRGYDTTSASVGLRYAINSSMAVSAEYLNTHYDFGPGVELPLNIARHEDRNVVRLGLTYGRSLLRPQPVRP